MSASFTDSEIATLFDAVPQDRPVAVAVSGGGDSMALLSLAMRWISHLTVLTVDHGLRAESAGEAALVAQHCSASSIDHETLTWHPQRRGNLSDQARIGRYTLMAEACAARGIDTLLTGHTLDDQAETVLMRLGRGSGVDGLSGIRPLTNLWGLRIVRPLLAIPRERLRGHLQSEQLPWVDDPTNEDRRYTRVQAREAMNALAPLGITPDRLARTARLMVRARDVLEEQTDSLATGLCDFSPLGFVSFDPAPLRAAPRETALRLLSRLLCRVSGNIYRPRLDGLETLLAALEDEAFPGRTLHGCRIDPYRGRCVIQREPSSCTATTRVTSSRVTWDDRFEICPPPGFDPSPELRIAAAGEVGLHRLKAEKVIVSKEWSAAPRPARLCAPAVWKGQALIGIPLAGWYADRNASGIRTVTINTVPVDPDEEAFI